MRGDRGTSSDSCRSCRDTKLDAVGHASEIVCFLNAPAGSDGADHCVPRETVSLCGNGVPVGTPRSASLQSIVSCRRKRRSYQRTTPQRTTPRSSCSGYSQDHARRRAGSSVFIEDVLGHSIDVRLPTHHIPREGRHMRYASIGLAASLPSCRSGRPRESVEKELGLGR
jgi:hypothetical protein